jgi:hypothetical protein
MIAEAQAEAVRVVGASVGTEAGLSAANLKVAELYVGAFKELAKTNNTLIIPSNMSDPASFIASAMTVLDRAKLGADTQRPAKT